MSVGAISSLSTIDAATANTSSNSTTSQMSSLNLDFTTYLKILTAQLKNQDPTNATDPNQFTQELIQMEQVQSQIKNNAQLEALAKATSANSLASGLGYIGNYVRADATNGNFSLQGSSAEIGYSLASGAAATIITIKDAAGKTVATLSGGTDQGDNYVAWNGAKADGTTAADGAYTFTISSLNNAGNTVTVSDQTALFKITGVQSNSDGTLTLDAGNLSLLSTDVTGVYTPSTKPASTAATLVTVSSSS